MDYLRFEPAVSILIFKREMENFTEVDLDELHRLQHLDEAVEWVVCVDTNDSASEIVASGLQECYNMTGHDMDMMASMPYSNTLPLSCQVIATVLHVIIFCWGVFGNAVLIHVVRKTHSLHRPTYCYLVSLACADLIVLLIAIPEGIMEYHIGMRWIFGQIGCSIMVFLNFLGINAGSLSIFAFAMERQFVVFHPMSAQKSCTVRRAKKIIVLLWLASILSCIPWFFFTEVGPDRDPRINICKSRLSETQSMIVFVADTGFFYLLPLIATAVAYVRIALKMKGISCCHFAHEDQPDTTDMFNSEHQLVVHHCRKTTTTSFSSYCSPAKARVSLRMLAIVVVVFALCCLPYRVLLIYNTFQDEEHKFWNIWYLLFAKTLIFLNSSINPTLYNVFSKQFRNAVLCYFWKGTKVTERQISHF